MAHIDGYEADPADVAALLTQWIDEEDRADPTLQYVRASKALALHTALCAELGRLRADAAARLHAGGLSYAQIGAHLGLSRPRAQQLVEKGR